MSQIVLFCEGDGDHRDRHVLTHSCPTLRSSDLLVITLTASIFALGGFINAVFARNFDDISIIPTFVLTPLTYLGGVFYSINLLSPFWQTDRKSTRLNSSH